MDEAPTCGKGLAAHAVVPARLAELLAATAKNLELHTASLDRSNANARREHDVYVMLANRHRAIEGELRQLAALMLSQRDLPMAEHDMEVLLAPASRAALAGLVHAEGAVIELLGRLLEEHRAMLPRDAGDLPA